MARSPKLKISAAAGAVLLWLFVSCAAFAQDERRPEAARRGHEILERLRGSFDHVAFSGTLRTLIYAPERTIEMAQSVKIGPGGKYRIEVISPKEMRGTLRAFDGKKFVLYHKARNAYFEAEVDDGPPHPLLQRLLDAVRPGTERWVTYEGKEKVVGREALVLKVGLPDAPHPRARIWVDAKEFIPLMIRDFRPDGTTFSETYLESVKFSSKFEQGTFTPKIPRGARKLTRGEAARLKGMGPAPLSLEELRERRARIQRGLGFRPRIPGELPPGFEVLDFGPRKIEGGRFVAMVVRTKGRVAFLLQTKADSLPRRDRNRFRGALKWDREQKAHTWRKDGVAFILKGDLTREEAARFARSLD